METAIKEAEWSKADEWGSCTCSACGYDNVMDHFKYCPRCGAKSKNPRPFLNYEYFCRNCGEKQNEFRIIPEDESHPQQFMECTCKKCKTFNVFTFDDAVKTVEKGWE